MISRYLLLLILNLPFILAGTLNAVVSYKLRHSSRRNVVARLIFWLFVLVGLAVAEPLYNYLSARDFTNTEPLSLFDVIQITAIVVLLYLSSRTRSRVDTLEKRLYDLHQVLSIKNSEKK